MNYKTLKYLSVLKRTIRNLKYSKFVQILSTGEGQYGEKNINNQIDEYIKFAQANPHNYKIPKLLFYFAGGVTRELAEHMKTRNVAISVSTEANN